MRSLLRLATGLTKKHRAQVAMCVKPVLPPNPTYTNIVNRINALIEINGEEAYLAFIDKANYYIDYYKTTIAARKGRSTKDKSTETTTK